MLYSSRGTSKGKGHGLSQGMRRDPSIPRQGICIIGAWRLECVECPVGNAVMNQQPSVFSDSCANETIRPWHADITDKKCAHTAVVTASGDGVAAFRTSDGSCASSPIKIASEDSRDWFLSIVEAGGSFTWTREGARVMYIEGMDMSTLLIAKFRKVCNSFIFTSSQFGLCSQSATDTDQHQHMQQLRHLLNGRAAKHVLKS